MWVYRERCVRIFLYVLSVLYTVFELISHRKNLSPAAFTPCHVPQVKTSRMRVKDSSAISNWMKKKDEAGILSRAFPLDSPNEKNQAWTFYGFVWVSADFHPFLSTCNFQSFIHNPQRFCSSHVIINHEHIIQQLLNSVATHPLINLLIHLIHWPTKCKQARTSKALNKLLIPQ